jgi:hypothetical protein
MAFSSRSLAVLLCVILVSLAFATRDALAARALLQGIDNSLILSIGFINNMPSCSERKRRNL